MSRIITVQMIVAFENYLYSDEKSDNTIKKYMRDIKKFYLFAKERAVDKVLLMDYKAEIIGRYKVSSANSIIAAVNAFLRFAGWTDCCVKQFKVQKKAFCSEKRELTKEDYTRLVAAAVQKGNERLSLIIQTICSTGMRVSELEFITAEAVRKGEATVSCKNKIRTVFIVRKLQKKLLNYIKRTGIKTGCIFITKTGKPISRCTVWREMKSLCKQSGVAYDKIFPHNLRHLFARTFYAIERDIAKLADILGHSSINTTRIYIITTGVEHRRKMENMRLII